MILSRVDASCKPPLDAGLSQLNYVILVLPKVVPLIHLFENKNEL